MKFYKISEDELLELLKKEQKLHLLHKAGVGEWVEYWSCFDDDNKEAIDEVKNKKATLKFAKNNIKKYEVLNV